MSNHYDCVGQQIKIGDWIILPQNGWGGIVFKQVTHFTAKSIKMYNKKSKPTYIPPHHCYKVPPEHVTAYLLRNSSKQNG